MLEIIQVAKLDKVKTKIRGIDIDIVVDVNTIYPHSCEALQEALH